MAQLRLVAQAPDDPPGRAAPSYSEAELHAMQRAVLALMSRWQTSDGDAAILLGGISTRTLQRWRSGDYGRIGPDLAARMSNLLGIHKALRLIFKDPERGYGWVKRENETFGGQSALAVMLQGQLTDLMRVRRYLDAQRGQW